MKKFILIFGLFFGFNNVYCDDSKIESEEEAKKIASDSNEEDDDSENDAFKKIKVFTKEDCENTKKEIKDKIRKNGKIICYYYLENVMNKKAIKYMQSLEKKFQNKNMKYIKKLHEINQKIDKEDMSAIQKFEELKGNFRNKMQLINKPYAEEVLKISKKVANAIFNDNSKVIEVRMVSGNFNHQSSVYFNPEASVDVSALYHVAILDEIDINDEKFNRIPKLDIDDLEGFED